MTDKGQEHWWLFKPIKPAGYRRLDDWSEKIAAELALLIGLPAATVELATDGQHDGIISKNVTPDGWALESGDTVLSDIEGYISCATDARHADRIGHNLGNITAVLKGCGGPPSSAISGWDATEVFAGYLVFDAWIANTDRHAINWSILTCERDGRRALAHSFDHGSALASGTQDRRLIATAPQAYADRGFAGRFEGGRRLPLVDLARTAVDRVGGRSTIWLERIKSIGPDQWEPILAAIPRMSEVRRTFLSRLLEINRRRLTT